MRISLGLTTSMPIQYSIHLATLAEQLGFYRCFVGEDILSREVFTYLSVIALKTRRIGIAPGITSPYVRNLAVLASNVFSLQKISGNRLNLGLGPGGLPEVEKLTGAIPQRPVDVLRETVEVIRRLLRGETVTYSSVNGSIILHNFKLHRVDAQMPRIYFGVRGPRLLALAGEVADGVIFSGSKGQLQLALRHVEEAATQTGRNSGDIEKTLWLPFIESKNLNEDIQLARIVVATVVSSLPQREAHEIPGISEVLHHFRQGKYQEAARFITEDIVREFCFIGSIEGIMDEVKKLEGYGFTELVVGPPFGRKPEETLWALKDYLE